MPRLSPICLALSAPLLLCLLLRPIPGWAKSPEERIGDIGQYLPALAGLAVAGVKHDPEGAKQLTRSLSASFLATQALKYGLNNTALGERPDGDDLSFPSGHTAMACSGAAFLGERYGWEYGLPALAVAAAVGKSRVDADRHHWRDVAAGCALSYAVNEFFVTRQGEEHLSPVVGPDFVGFRVKFDF